MAYPVIQGYSNTSKVTSNSTTHVVTLPVAIQAGELLVVVFSIDGNPTITPSAGWSIADQYANGSNVRGAILYKVATGGDTLTVTSSVAEQSSAICYRISGADSVLADWEYSTSSTPWTWNLSDPTPGTDHDYLWMAGLHSNGIIEPTGVASGWTGLLTNAAATAEGTSTSTQYKTSEGVWGETATAWSAASHAWVTHIFVVWNRSSAPTPSHIAGGIQTQSTCSGELKGTGQRTGSTSALAVVTGTLLAVGLMAGALTSGASTAGQLEPKPTIAAIMATASGQSVTGGAVKGTGRMVGSGPSSTVLTATIRGQILIVGTTIGRTTTQAMLNGKGSIDGSTMPKTSVNASLTGLGSLNGGTNAGSNGMATFKGMGLLLGQSHSATALLAHLEEKAPGPTGNAMSLTLVVGELAGKVSFTGTASTGTFNVGTVIGIGQIKGNALGVAISLGEVTGLALLSGSIMAGCSLSLHVSVLSNAKVYITGQWINGKIKVRHGLTWIDARPRVWNGVEWI